MLEAIDTLIKTSDLVSNQESLLDSRRIHFGGNVG